MPALETHRLNNDMPSGAFSPASMLLHMEKPRRHRQEVKWLKKIGGVPLVRPVPLEILAHVQMALPTCASLAEVDMV